MKGKREEKRSLLGKFMYFGQQVLNQCYELRMLCGMAEPWADFLQRWTLCQGWEQRGQFIFHPEFIFPAFYGSPRS